MSKNFSPAPAEISLELHLKLFKRMKEVVTKASSELDDLPIPAIPISYKLSEDSEEIPIAGDKDGRFPTMPAGEIEASFELPEDLPLNGLDLEKLMPLEGTSPQINRQFTLAKRLKKWKIKRQLRHNGVRDKYYHHHGYKGHFRSVNEVREFILYEMYPKTEGKSSSSKKRRYDDTTD